MDTVLMREGDEASAFFFVYYGKTIAYQSAPSDVSDQAPRKKNPLGILGPDSYFGEISILTNTPCRASIETVSKCMLLKVPKEVFRDTWCAIPQFRAEFMVRILGKACRLEHVMGHTLTKAAFHKFVKSEHASENTDFIDAVNEFQKNHEDRTGEENLELGFKIIKDFLTVESAQQVNVSDSMTKTCVSEMNDLAAKVDLGLFTATDPTMKNASRYVFDKLKDEIFNILEQGPLPRFKRSPGFALVLTELHAYEQMDLSNVPGAAGTQAVKDEGASTQATKQSHRTVLAALPPPAGEGRNFDCYFETLSENQVAVHV